VSNTNVLALQGLPETQSLNSPGMSIGALKPCTHTCGNSCQITCVEITCRYGWTCASTYVGAAERESPDRPNVNLWTSTW
jgi:hypothetical protein